MQLKLTYSQREGGIISKNAIFCLDARVGFTPAEQESITRYKLAGQVIYNSEASKRHLDKGDAAVDGSTMGYMKSLARTAMAAMNLNISIGSLQRGQHVECKSLDELVAAEEAIKEACRNLKSYLERAAMFDGREVLLTFSGDGEVQVVAQASAPAPMLVAPSSAPVEETTFEPMSEEGKTDWIGSSERYEEAPQKALNPIEFIDSLTPNEIFKIIGVGIFLLLLYSCVT